LSRRNFIAAASWQLKSSKPHLGGGSPRVPTIQYRVAPIPVLMCHSNHQTLDHCGGPRSPRSALATAVVLLGDQFPMPASSHAVVRPKSDTLYSMAWLDLSREPILVHVPDTGGRYYVVQLLDAWTETFAASGKRTHRYPRRLVRHRRPRLAREASSRGAQVRGGDQQGLACGKDSDEYSRGLRQRSSHSKGLRTHAAEPLSRRHTVGVN
jgi:hypothetical protein